MPLTVMRRWDHVITRGAAVIELRATLRYLDGIADKAPRKQLRKLQRHIKRRIKDLQEGK